MPAKRVWTREEELIVERNYQKGIPWLVEELGRTKHSVNQKVSRMGLNLHRPFLSDEDNFIIENIGSLSWSDLGKSLNRAVGSVMNLNTPYLERKWLKVKEVLNDQKI